MGCRPKSANNVHHLTAGLAPNSSFTCVLNAVSRLDIDLGVRGRADTPYSRCGTTWAISTMRATRGGARRDRTDAVCLNGATASRARAGRVRANPWNVESSCEVCTPRYLYEFIRRMGSAPIFHSSGIECGSGADPSTTTADLGGLNL